MRHPHVRTTQKFVEAHLAQGLLLQSGQAVEDATEHIALQRLTLPHPTVLQTYACWIGEMAESWGSRAIHTPCPPDDEATQADAVSSVIGALQAVLELDLPERDADRRMVIIFDWSRLLYGGKAPGAILVQRSKPSERPALTEFRTMVSALLIALQFHAGA